MKTKMCHTINIYTLQIFILFSNLLCIMKHCRKINESGFKFHFDSLLDMKGFPPENL